MTTEALTTAGAKAAATGEASNAAATEALAAVGARDAAAGDAAASEAGFGFLSSRELKAERGTPVVRRGPDSSSATAGAAEAVPNYGCGDRLPCASCGCSREFDAYGDRVCWCDACVVRGCMRAGTEAWIRG